MVKTICLFILVFLILPFSSAFAKTLTIVTLQSPPAEYSENSQPTGRNVEIVREALKRMGYLCNIDFVPWIRALEMVKHGKADCIIDVAFNSERAEYLYYPDEVLYVEEWYCFKIKEADITLDNGLGNAGKFTVGVTRGFEYGGIIQEAINTKRFKGIQEVYNNELNIKKLVANRFDMFVGVNLTISYLSRKMGLQNRIERVKMTGTDIPYLLNESKTYLGFSKITMNREIADVFSNVLAEMKKDGTVKRIEGRYY